MLKNKRDSSITKVTQIEDEPIYYTTMNFKSNSRGGEGENFSRESLQNSHSRSPSKYIMNSHSIKNDLSLERRMIMQDGL